MKLLLGLLYLLLGASRFYEIPVHDDLFLSQYKIVSMKPDTIPQTAYIPEKVLLASFNVLTVTDTAFKTEDIGRLLNEGYGEIFSFIGQHQLRAGRVMAFYHTSQLPFVFDAAVEVDSLPDQLTGKVKAGKIMGGEAIVVHYQGPYEGVGVAYSAIASWLKENNKRTLDAPFEIYLNDPFTVKDPQQLRTDVYQRIQ